MDKGNLALAIVDLRTEECVLLFDAGEMDAWLNEQDLTVEDPARLWSSGTGLPSHYRARPVVCDESVDSTWPSAGSADEWGPGGDLVLAVADYRCVRKFSDLNQTEVEYLVATDDLRATVLACDPETAWALAATIPDGDAIRGLIADALRGGAQ